MQKQIKLKKKDSTKLTSISYTGTHIFYISTRVEIRKRNLTHTVFDITNKSN